ncbi:ArsR/SmtB family transcription factor [Salinibacter grassmerensis]|uniref:ArsR/SmtB family transcription factor n=1 Tax=Salinibacter grassmerensis TaxID=3040353 RepID=UPI0021E6E414|nr:metalloregulator ArsR/SmtB family transcription factor [Salinibacter grassmerensis]
MQTKADQFDAETTEIAEQAKALSHPARLAILRVLAERSECICGEIVEDLPLAQSTVSRHLKVLKEAGLIQGTVDGPSVCYCLDPEPIAALRDQFDTFFDGLSTAADSISC